MQSAKNEIKKNDEKLMAIDEMKKKLDQCKKWGVQIADCRFRPLDQTFDNYNPRRKQTNSDYHIHPNWTDTQIKLFRRKVREQNIVIRHGFSFYSRELERLGGRRIPLRVRSS